MTKTQEHANGRKAVYRRLCSQQASITLFQRDWWLDALCGDDNWDVALAEIGNEVVGALPYRIRSVYGFTYIGQPPLSAALGPWIRPRQSKPAQRLAYEKDVMTALIDNLPPFSVYRQTWQPEITNWLPFHWRGFEQTTLYTYILEDLRDEKKLWSGLRENIRTDIRKASSRFGVRVRDDLDLDAFLELSGKTFQRQGLTLPYTRELVMRLDKTCADRGSRAILIGEDAEGRRHAGAYIAWDENTAYYLMGGGDPALRNSGATALCLWEAIRLAARVSRRFDFEGSMVEPIERHFRAYGGTLTPYFLVQKTASPIINLAFSARKLLRRRPNA